MSDVRSSSPLSDEPEKKTHCQIFEEWWTAEVSTEAFQGPRFKKWWEYIKSGSHSQEDLAREAFMSGIRVGRSETAPYKSEREIAEEQVRRDGTPETHEGSKE